VLLRLEDCLFRRICGRWVYGLGSEHKSVAVAERMDLLRNQSHTNGRYPPSRAGTCDQGAHSPDPMSATSFFYHSSLEQLSQSQPNRIGCPLISCFSLTGVHTHPHPLPSSSQFCLPHLPCDTAACPRRSHNRCINTRLSRLLPTKK
jgi:hypothetical protein